MCSVGEQKGSGWVQQGMAGWPREAQRIAAAHAGRWLLQGG